MGLWDAVRGRKPATRPNLDSLFLVPSAAVTLQTGIGLLATGNGSVCFRAAEGAAFRQTQSEVVDLLNADPDAPDVQASTDDFGFTWLTVGRDDVTDVPGICTDLHAVNTALEEQGFGSGLLCTLVPFADDGGRRVGLVYLYGRGTFYPFAPSGPQQRDNLLEIQVRDALAAELPIEKDLQRWLAVWGAPGL
jgi:hypothetical protein